jgi:hypothetical protein
MAAATKYLPRYGVALAELYGMPTHDWLEKADVAGEVTGKCNLQTVEVGA